MNGFAPDDFAPVALVEAELSGPLESVPTTDASGRAYCAAHVLVRLHTRPLAVLELELGTEGLPGDALAGSIWERLGPRINAHLRDDGLPEVSCIDRGGLGPRSSTPRCLEARAALLRAAPHASVIVGTRNRPDVIGRCLGALQEQEYPNYAIIVADGSRSPDTRQIVERDFPAVQYVRIEQGGVCVGKNCALREAAGEVVAFTDDDAVADRHWLAEHVAALGSSERVACTTGLALALELDTPAQLWFEESGAFVEGLERRSISLERRERHSLLPYATGRIGAGVNMAWRTQVLRELGGFDPALDSCGAEDLALFFDAMCAGYEIVYEPGAIVHHQHRRTYDELARQIYWHSVGLGAYLTRCLVTQPGRIPELLARVPRGVLYGFHSTSPRNTKKSTNFPPALTRAERRGVVSGPYAYLKGARAAKRRLASDG